jgi:hypothetical protein
MGMPGVLARHVRNRGGLTDQRSQLLVQLVQRLVGEAGAYVATLPVSQSLMSRA